MIKVFFVLLILTTEGCSILIAQDVDFSFSGSYRLRGEVMNDYNIKSYATDKKEDFIISRLRADFAIEFFNEIKLNLQLQDSREMGSSLPNSELKGNNPIRDYMDINQLNVTYDNDLIKIKIGRQQIFYRDNRVFGPGNWSNTGRYVWDAGIISLNTEYFKSDFIVGKYVLHNPEIWTNKFFNNEAPTAYSLYNSVKQLPFALDVFYVIKNDNRGTTQGESGTGNLNSHSVGFWLNGIYNKWEYCAMLAHQFGDYGSDKISALGLFFSLGYNLNTSWKPIIQVQYTYGSGDENPNDGINNTFDGIFGGADSKLYGWMNIFFWKNLTEYRINLSATPIKDWNIRVEYHYFRLTESKDAWYFPGNSIRRDITGNSGMELGHEFDFILSTKIQTNVEVLTGYSFFVPGEFVKNTGTSPFADWYFFETTFYF